MSTMTANEPAQAGPGTPQPTTNPAAEEQATDPVAAIEALRGEIDTIDAELVRLIQRRTELSKEIGAARASHGGTRIVYSREMKVLDRFAELGPSGTDLGMLLLSLGRGKLGRR